MRALLRKLVLIAIGLAAATAFVEIAVRATVASPLWRSLPVPEVALYGPDPFTGYRHRPDVQGVWVQENRSWVVTSHLGLRDRERSFVRGPAPRAVVLGNSRLEALQVDLKLTAVYIAEQLLQDRHKGAEVVNLGLAGATPAVEVARLQSLGVALKPDIAVVVMPVNEIFSHDMLDDSMVAAYRAGNDGQFTLHYGFRNTRGYRFRTSRWGDFFYWMLDHSETMSIYNNRKNVGWFTEWPRQAAKEAAPASCLDAGITNELELWRDRSPARPNLLLEAMIRDLSAIAREHRIKIVIASIGLGFGCPDQAAERTAAIDAMRTRLNAAGIQLVDFDGLVAAKVGADNVANLHGFRDRIGGGHLNVKGNRVYGEVLAQVIAEALANH
jgi:hypothetical protein